MNQELLKEITTSQINTEVPSFRTGDTLRVGVHIKEGNRERVQFFEGVVIGRKGHGVSATFTVRKMSNGIGVERIFPVNSPAIESIKVMRTGKVRRAKLGYIRGLSAKKARIKERKAF